MAHLLIVPEGKIQDAQSLAPGWKALPVGSYKPQKLEMYWMSRVLPDANSPSITG